MEQPRRGNLFDDSDEGEDEYKPQAQVVEENKPAASEEPAKQMKESDDEEEYKPSADPEPKAEDTPQATPTTQEEVKNE